MNGKQKFFAKVLEQFGLPIAFFIFCKIFNVISVSPMWKLTNAKPIFFSFDALF